MSMPVKVVTHITGGLTVKQQGGKPAGANICLNAHGTTVSAMVMDDRGCPRFDL